jgi:pantetheine-phosphate adenylyltransferase
MWMAPAPFAVTLVTQGGFLLGPGDRAIEAAPLTAPSRCCLPQTMRIAFYPGTFDPVTNGHVDLLRTALTIADEVVVAVGVNAGKSPMFSLAERLEMIAAIVATLRADERSRVTSTSFEGLTVDAARKAGASIIVRGVRDSADFDYEMQMAAMNGDLAPELHTVFVPARPAVRHVTATLVRQIAAHGADISPFVPPAVAKVIARHFPR